jgi:hypothetical protein
MKATKIESEKKKFELEKFEFAKLKNIHLIRGGDGNDPIDTNRKTVDASSDKCNKND